MESFLSKAAGYGLLLDLTIFIRPTQNMTLESV